MAIKAAQGRSCIEFRQCFHGVDPTRVSNPTPNLMYNVNFQFRCNRLWSFRESPQVPLFLNGSTFDRCTTDSLSRICGISTGFPQSFAIKPQYERSRISDPQRGKSKDA